MEINGLSFSLALAVGAIGVALAGYAIARVSAEEKRWRDVLRDELATARARLAELGESVEDMIERARVERARADGRRGGRPPTAAAPANGASSESAIKTRDEYVRHLERGGRPLPDVERALGL